jgi:hypothetical protein
MIQSKNNEYALHAVEFRSVSTTVAVMPFLIPSGTSQPGTGCKSCRPRRLHAHNSNQIKMEYPGSIRRIYKPSIEIGVDSQSHRWSLRNSICADIANPICCFTPHLQFQSTSTSSAGHPDLRPMRRFPPGMQCTWTGSKHLRRRRRRRSDALCSAHFARPRSKLLV